MRNVRSFINASYINGLDLNFNGNDVRAAYADQRMDENKVGCYRVLIAMRNVAQPANGSYNAGATYDSNGSSYGLYNFRLSPTAVDQSPLRVGNKVPGKWVAMNSGNIKNSTVAVNVNAGGAFMALWHRYE